MKLIIIMLTTCLMQVSAASFGQKLTLVKQNVSLKEVFREIRQQTGYNVLWPSEKLDAAKTVNANFREKQLSEVLDELLKGQSLSYSIDRKTVRIAYAAPSFLDKVVDAFTPPIDVYGVVLDEKGQPLAGATVKVKGFKISTTSDKDGRFYLSGVNDEAVLVISYVGYRDVEIGIQTSLSVSMEMKSDELQEVVVAYGKTTQQALTGAVAVVKGTDIQKLNDRSFDRSLQGLIPGLQITSGNGLPGGGLSNFVLRGIGTGVSTDNGSTVRYPLIVIDGIAVSTDPTYRGTGVAEDAVSFNNPLATLNPQDIESISVLKDASAIALYGSKASNGVILITTKKGSLGKSTVSFRHQSDFASALRGKLKFLSQDQYLELLYESYKNLDPDTWKDDVILNDLKTKFPLKSNGDFYGQSDWIGSITRNLAYTISNDLTFSGGTEITKYYVNLGQLSQKGAVKNTGFDQGSLRVNLENNSFKWLKLGINTTFTHNLQNYFSASEFSDNPLGVANLMSPLNPIRNEEGDYVLNFIYGTPAFSTTANPLAALEYNIKRATSYRGLGNFFAEANFLKHFQLSTNIGGEFLLSQHKDKLDPRLADAGLNIGPNTGQIWDRDVTTTGYTFTNMLKYNNNLGHHSVGILLGQESRILNNRILTGAKRGTRLPVYDELIEGTTLGFLGNLTKETLLSYFSQLNYDFSDKYFVTFSGRKDGASKFGSNKRFDSSYSIGGAWVASEENFLKPLNKIIDFLKIRGSLGIAGSSNSIDRYTRFDLLNYLVVAGGTVLVPGQIGNPDIEPEETFNTDMGLELRLLNSRLTLTADIYKRKISKLIYPQNLPNNSGYASTLLRNIGDMENKGLELSISGDAIKDDNFVWNISVNWSTNKNTLIKANSALTAAGNLINKEGENFNSFYLVRWAGVNPDDGTPQWYDINGNITSTFNYDDRVIVGKPQPDGFGSVTNSFRYKNFELSGMIFYQYGFKIFKQSDIQDGRMPFTNQSVDALDRWQKPGDLKANPRNIFGNTDSFGPSTRDLFQGDFLRLKNLRFSWQFSQGLSKKLHVNNAQIFVQGNNLVTWTKFPGDDPDNMNLSGTNYTAYPQQRTYSLGLKVTL